MGKIAYVNGRYLAHRDARVHVEDRGYQFSDGVYEVIAIRQGCLVDEDLHFKRLARSLGETRIDWPMSRAALQLVLRQMIRRNGIVADGSIYIQITRGVAPRNHLFPAGLRPSLVITAKSLPRFDPEATRRGVAVITLPDQRWKRPDIKSVSLLPNVLDKQKASEQGAYEAWLVDEAGFVTEGTASNAWIVSRDGEVVTRHADHALLSGITRTAVLSLARDHGLRLVQRPFTVDEAKQSPEAFLTSTTSLVKPIIRIDDVRIGTGAIGPMTEALLTYYFQHLDA